MKLISTYVLCCFLTGSISLALAQNTKSGVSKTPDTIKKINTFYVKGFGKKEFDTLSNYNTLSFGLNAGITSGLVPFLNNSTNHFKGSLGYGATLKQQLSNFFSLQFDYYGGKVQGNDVAGQDNSGSTASKFGGTSFSTTFNQISVSGVVDFGSVSYLHRANTVDFYGSAGIGVDFYKPTWFNDAGQGPFTYTSHIKELAIPVGVGVKFKLTDALALNIGHTITFVNGYNFSGFKTYPVFNHYEYTYTGLAYTFGPKTKHNIEWVNPVAKMYDTLYDEGLKQELWALKGRIANVEMAVSDLKKDSDGDGVSDQFDKCPNTYAGSIVDGSGCPLVFAMDTVSSRPTTVGISSFQNIQFEFGSSILKTSSYPMLDATSANLRANVNEGWSVELDGHTSSEKGEGDKKNLSMARALSVKTYLINSGVYGWSIYAKGLDKMRPLASNETEEGRVLNRRVEMKSSKFHFYKSVKFSANLSAIKNLGDVNDAISQLTKNPSWRIFIIGHCSDSENNAPHTEKDNYALSLKRARAVLNYLKYKGVKPSRIFIQAYGSKQPVSNSDQKPEEHIENQSAELFSF